MLAAITTYFNPISYDAITRNYWMFREALGVDLFTIELSFNNNFEIPDAIHVSGGTEHIFWQRERLLNLLLPSIPDKYDTIAWLDADILFENKKWAEEAERKLNEFRLVQLFDTLQITDHLLDAKNKIPCATKNKSLDWRTNMGCAWAARRDTLQQQPFLDTFIMGGAECMMYYAAIGKFKHPMMTRLNIEWRHSYLTWAAGWYRSICGQVNHVPGMITHLYHGTYADDDYLERWLILSENQFCPEEDLTINENGIWEWKSDKKALRSQVAKYYKDRADDEEWIKKMRQKDPPGSRDETLPGGLALPFDPA